MKNYPLLIALVCMCPLLLRAQAEVNCLEISPTTTWSGYIEPYYSFDFSQPENGNLPGFLYSFNRHNEFNVNLGFIKANYSSCKVRANAALAVGSYMSANYSAEAGVAQHILEMNAGLRLSPKHDLWLDAGVFGSHIGFESAIGKDCRNLTRSMMAENSPYFESGAKITYNSHNKKWLLSALLLNGWQRIKRVEGNSLPSFGTQVQFKPSQKVLLNSSTFWGTDKPDAKRQIRFFHNFYTTVQISNDWETTLAFDIGLEQESPGSKKYNNWHTLTAVARYAVTSDFALALRGEYYQDQAGVIIVGPDGNSFNTASFSLNIDYSIAPNALCRLEGRLFNSDEPVFLTPTAQASKTNSIVTASLAVGF